MCDLRCSGQIYDTAAASCEVPAICINIVIYRTRNIYVLKTM